MDAPKTREEYEVAAAELDSKHALQLSALEQKAQAGLRRIAEGEVRVALMTCGEVVPEAIDDLVRKLADDVIIFPDGMGKTYIRDGDGRPMRRPDDPRQIMSVSDYIKDYLRARPWLRRDAGISGPAGGRAPGSTSSSARSSWDFQRALKDSAYNAEWKINDPQGHAKAWSDHLTKLDADLRRQNYQ